MLMTLLKWCCVQLAGRGGEGLLAGQTFFVSLKCHISDSICAPAGIARSLSDGNRLEDASQSATSFKQMFQQQYGPTCPDFVETSWEEATAQAHRQFKFLMVYLHAAEHQVCLYPPPHVV